MNSPDYAITNYIWTVAILLKLALMGIIISRKAYLEYPAFTLYIALSVVRSLALYAIAFRYYGPMYYWTFWIGQSVITVVLVGVMFEVLQSAFKTACSVFPQYMRNMLRISILVVIVLSAFAYQLNAEPTLVELVRRLDRTSSLLLLASFGITALVSNHLGLVWKPRTYGIALGFLFYYGVEAFVTVLMAGFDYAVPALNAVEVFAFLIAEGVWIGYLGPRRAHRQISRAEIDRVSEALQAIAR